MATDKFEYIDIIVMSSNELLALNWLLQWTKVRTQHSDWHLAAGHLALAVEPALMFSHEDAIAKALRKALERVLHATELLENAQNLKTYAEPTPEDMFSCEKCPMADAYCALTEAQEPVKVFACAESWAYHCAVNGLLHPLTRKPIVGFARLGDHLERPKGLPRALQKFMALSPALRKQWLADIHTDMALNIFRQDMSLETFEKVYGIPDDRKLSALVGQANPQDDDHMVDDGALLQYVDQIVSFFGPSDDLVMPSAVALASMVNYMALSQMLDHIADLPAGNL